MTRSHQDPSANPEAYTLEEIQGWVLGNQDDDWLSKIYDTLDDLNDMYYVTGGPSDSDLSGDNIFDLRLGCRED